MNVLHLANIILSSKAAALHFLCIASIALLPLLELIRFQLFDQLLELYLFSC